MQSDTYLVFHDAFIFHCIYIDVSCTGLCYLMISKSNATTTPIVLSAGSVITALCYYNVLLHVLLPLHVLPPPPLLLLLQ